MPHPTKCNLSTPPLSAWLRPEGGIDHDEGMAATDASAAPQPPI